MGEKKFDEKTVMKILNTLYEKSKEGVPKVSKPVSELAEEYLAKYTDIDKATKAMLKNQIKKCATSGFLTGFGGAITLPVTLPANLTSVLYVQMRMIACAAYMAGLDLDSDQTQTFVYACLAGVSVNEVVKKFGIKFGNKVAESAIKRIPGKTLTAINQKVGFRFITKFGEKGLINLGKMIPVVGAVINGGLDFFETKAIANRTYKEFVLNDFDIKESEDDVIDVDFVEIDDKKTEKVRKDERKQEYEWLVENNIEGTPKSLSAYTRMKHEKTIKYQNLKIKASEQGRVLDDSL